MDPAFERIAALLKTTKQFSNKRMRYRRVGGIGFEGAFSDIRHMACLVDKHVIPALVLGRTRAGNCLIPLVRAFERGIDIKYHTAIVEPLVVH